MAALVKANSNYRRGSAFEYQIAERLRADGYTVVRSAGSHGAFDLIAFKTREIVMAQLKINGNITAAEWNRLWELAQMVDGPYAEVIPLVVSRVARGRIRYLRMTGPATPRGRASGRPGEVWASDALAAASNGA